MSENEILVVIKSTRTLIQSFFEIGRGKEFAFRGRGSNTVGYTLLCT